MKPNAYLETTIVSYLTARPSRDLITAANQQMTHDWWEDHREQFALYVSQFVVEEASAGDPDAATRRLAVLADLPPLDVTDAVQQLAHALLTHVPLPANAQGSMLAYRCGHRPWHGLPGDLELYAYCQCHLAAPD